MGGKKQKGGNKRLETNPNKPHKQAKGAQAENIGERLAEIRDTESIEELIELTKHENNTVRLRAAQQMCPCRV